MDRDKILAVKLPLPAIRAELSRNGLLYFIGFGSWLASLSLYAAYGFSFGILILWLVALATIGFCLYEPGQPRTSIDRKDILAALGLAVMFAPLYLLLLHEIPFQIGFDEISVMVYEDIQLARPADLFGISEYAGFPAAMFLIFGWLGEALGGVGLANMRLVHAIGGLLILALSYAFFRQFMTRRLALAASVVLGSNHALLAISRMGQWDNSALLLELVALAALIYAFKRESRFGAYLAGAAAGLTFYVYFPSRATFPIWLLSILVAGYFARKRVPRENLGRLVRLSSLGFVLVVVPVLIAGAQNSRINAGYYKRQLLIFPEGRELQRSWMKAESELEGLWINVAHGLTTFNNLEHDQGFVYPNRGHGFLDPFTGILLWAGVFVVGRRLHRGQNGDALSLVGFGVLWLFYAFGVNQSPNYTRLLVTLPFVSALAVAGMASIADQISDRLGRAGGSNWILGLGLLTVFAWNMSIYAEFIRQGFERSDLVGATARYVEARSGEEQRSLHLVTTLGNPYFTWGNEDQWEHWIGFFAGDGQNFSIVDPELCLEGECVPPFTAFMSRKQWDLIWLAMGERFPNLHLVSIIPDGSRVAIEVDK
jgi:4-amino-4-deoxy-L-arabinose transferase-like glycosyltransferase